jgi:hypothetical protein
LLSGPIRKADETCECCLLSVRIPEFLNFENSPSAAYQS